MHMLVMLVTLLSRHKSSFSYLPHLLPGSAIISTHTVSPHLLLFHLLQNTERDRNFQPLCGQRASASLFFPEQDVVGNISWHFWVQKCFSSSCHSESLSGEWLSESPTDAALQLADHISLSI